MHRKFKVVLFLVTMLAIALRAYLFFARPNENEAWDKLLTFVVAVVACAAAIYTIHDTAMTVEANTAHARIAASFQFLHKLDAGGLARFSEFRRGVARDI